MDDSFTRWSFFILRAMTIPVIMFNMLIAIMGDTYDKVSSTAVALDKKTMAQMILDIESLMVWNRDRQNYEYIYICKYDAEDETDGGEWTGKIRAMQDKIDGISAGQNDCKKEIVDLNKKVDSVKDSVQQILDILNEKSPKN